MKKTNKFLIVFFILLTIVLLTRMSLPFLGHFLLVEDLPLRSDLIVVLMGSGPERMLRAVELYQEGQGKEIVLVKNFSPGHDLVASRGVQIPHDSELAKEAAVQLGVPIEDVKILPGDARSTQDEALAIRTFLEIHKDIDSLIIVTSQYHSRRAKVIFQKAVHAVDRPIRVLSIPTPYDDFSPKGWWTRREDLKRGVMEYLKLLNFYLKERFEL